MEIKIPTIKIKGNLEDYYNVASDVIEKKEPQSDLERRFNEIEWRKARISALPETRLRQYKGEMEQETIPERMLKVEKDREEYLTERGELKNIMVNRACKDFLVGVGGTAESMIGAAEWVSPKIMKPFFEDKGDQVALWRQRMTPKETNFLDEVIMGAGSAATFFIPGIGVGRAALTLAKVSPKLALLFGNITATALESATEAGGVYREKKDLGANHKEASWAATKTFILNSFLIGLTNKFGIFSDNTTSILKRIAMSSPIEGFQEYWQEVIQNVNTGKPAFQHAFKSGVIGAILGIPMGGISGVSFNNLTTTDQHKVIEKELLEKAKELGQKMPIGLTIKKVGEPIPEGLEPETKTQKELENIQKAKAPEEEAIYQAEVMKEMIPEIQKAQGQLFRDIKDLGGIKAHRGTLAEELKPIPLILKNRKTGSTLDELAQELNTKGYNFEGENDLLATILNTARERKFSKTVQPKQGTLRGLKIALDKAFAMGRRLTPFESKGVAKAFETFIKKGGMKDKMITMSDEKLLKIRLKAEARGAKTGERLGRVETRTRILNEIKEEKIKVQTIKQDIVDYAREYLDLHERGKLLATVKNVKSYNDLSNAKEYIERLSTQATKRTLRIKIKRELKNTKIRKQSGKPVGKFTPEVQITLNKLRQASKFTKTEAELRIQYNLEKHKNSIPPEDVALENKILSMIAGMDEMSISELRSVLNEIRTIKATGKLTAELKKFNRKTETEMWVNKAIDIITGGKGVPDNISTIGVKELPPKNLKEHIQKFIGTTGKIYMGEDETLDMLARKTKAKPYSTWLDDFGDVTNQENAVKKGIRINTDKIREMAQETLNVKNDRELVKRFKEDAEEVSLGVFKNTQGKMSEIIYTKAEARKSWMELQDPTLMGTFKLGMFYTDEIIDSIENFLTPQDKAFAQKQLEFYQDYYKSVNKIYRDIYGVDLPKNEFYSPIKRDGINREDSIGFGEFLQEISVRKSVTSGSLKSRVKNIKPLHNQSDVAVLEQHIAEMEHFKGWAHKIRDLRAVFGNPQVRAAIIREHGKGMLALVDNFLNDFTRGGTEIASRLSWLDRLRGNFSRAVLAGKGAIGVKQLTSFIGYADVVPPIDFGKGTIDFWLNPLEKIRILKQSEMMKVRGKHMERDIKTAVRSDAYSSFRKHPSFLNTLMLNIQLGDQGAIYAGGWSLYKYQRKLGKSHSEALHIFERETSKVQQSSDLSKLSSWQRGGSFAKLFTMFQSAPNMFFRKELGAIRNAIHGRGTIQQHAKTIVVFHFLIPMFFQFVSDWFKWNPEEQKRAMILGPFNGMFIVGDGLDSLIRTALGMRAFSSEIPLYSISDDIGKTVKLINDDDITTEDVFRAIRGLAGATGALKGLPLKQPIDIGAGIEHTLTGEYERGLAEILGWSPYVAKEMTKKPKKKGIPTIKIPTIKTNIPTIKIPTIKVDL